MEYENIKKLMDDMGKSNLTEINIDFPDGTKITMKKDTNEVKKEIITVKSEEVAEVNDENETAVIKELKQSKKLSGNVVKSPMVGTFYAKPSPTSAPYVEIGKQVKKGETLCIIEAMKLMNEIESEFNGVIKEILVEDGETVEYGKPLFVIE